eukprot:scaffold197687_cov46-Prasinocladus_malaysianus.AAC.1
MPQPAKRWACWRGRSDGFPQVPPPGDVCAVHYAGDSVCDPRVAGAEIPERVSCGRLERLS